MTKTFKTKTGIKVKEESVKSLDELYTILNTQKSIYSRHRVFASSFFLNWSIRQCSNWIKSGWFKEVIKENGE
jgi:hypothetical protein